MKVTCLLGFLFLLVDPASSHGDLTSPRSRNWYSNMEGLDWGTSDGSPSREYCSHCLNLNHGVCGVSPGADYDEWIDSKGNPMPWR